MDMANKELLTRNKRGKGRHLLPFLFLGLSMALVGACQMRVGYLWPAGETSLPSAQPVTPIPATSATNAPTPSPTAQPMCGAAEPVWTLLMIAKDYEAHNKEGLGANDYRVGFADAVRLARVDFRDGSVRMISLPRDMLVRIAGLEEYNITRARLKMTYAYGYQYQTEGLGIGLAATSLEKTFGISIDRGVAINFAAFVAIVDKMGGIEVDVPTAVGDFVSGTQHMDGTRALAYAQIRQQAGEDTSDASRVKRQTQMLLALRDKALSPAGLVALPSLLPQFLQLVVTDLGPLEMNRLMCLAAKGGTLEIDELPAGLAQRSLDERGNELVTPLEERMGEFLRAWQAE